MTIEKLVRCCHGMSVWAVYEFKGYRLEVYLRHNRPCRKEYGMFTLSCYLKPKNNDLELRDSKTFDDYLSFRNYRDTLENSL